MEQTLTAEKALDKKVPGPKGLPLLGNLLDLRKDSLGFIKKVQKEFGDIAHFKAGKYRIYLVSHPDYAQRVFQDHYKNYGKQTKAWRKFRDFLGNGLLSNEGEFWKRQRRISQPAFHRDKIASFAAQMVQDTEELLKKWETAYQKNEPIDISSEMMHVTLQIMGETLLSANLSGDAEKVREAMTTTLRITNERLRSFIEVPLSIPTPKNRRFLKARQTLDDIVYKIIEDRQNKKNQYQDLLSMLMNTVDEETDERMNKKQLRDEVMTIFLAGHETTANALSWTFYLLSQKPEAEERLSSEIHSVLNGRAPTLADIPQLAYTERVVKESMRLCPPVPIIGRSVTEDDEMGGYFIPKNSVVLTTPYLTHRHPDFWENPEKFDPDRFLSERFSKLPKYAYFPFGGGPRLCIGNNFAMMEAVLILATIAQRYQLKLIPDQKIEVEVAITLRPKYGIKMQLEKRLRS